MANTPKRPPLTLEQLRSMLKTAEYELKMADHKIKWMSESIAAAQIIKKQYEENIVEMKKRIVQLTSPQLDYYI